MSSPYVEQAEKPEQPQVYDAEIVRVRHPEAGEALVPRMSLSQMDPRWQIVDDETATEPAQPETEPEPEPAAFTRRSRTKKES